MTKNTYKAYTAEMQTKAIASISRRGKLLRKDADELANGFIMKYNEDGDFTKVMTIADTFGETFTKAARTAFLEWCIAYTKTLRWNDTDKVMVHVKRKNTGNGERMRTHTETVGETTVTTEHFEKSFFDFVVAKENPVKMIARLESLLKSSEKACEKGLNDGYTSQQVTELREFALEKGWIEANA